MTNSLHSATPESARSPILSVVIPAYNEGDSLRQLTDEISGVISSQLGIDYEILIVDDGSTDRSWSVLKSVTEANPKVRAFRLRRNFGKAAALMVGFRHAEGQYIATMDADLQDDPKELPNFLAKLQEGFDFVVGWKKDRKDPLSKTLPSKLFNFATSVVFGLSMRDFNCGFKIGRREVFSAISIYGELHRYIPVLAYDAGFAVTEIPVVHHPRQFGTSKYGFKRYMRGLLDLLTVVMLTRYNWRPAHLFGGIGLVFGFLGSAIMLYLSGLKIFTGALIGDRPLLLLGVLLFMTGIQFVFFGMLAEMILSQRKNDDIQPLIAESISRDTRRD